MRLNMNMSMSMKLLLLISICVVKPLQSFSLGTTTTTHGNVKTISTATVTATAMTSYRQRQRQGTSSYSTRSKTGRHRCTSSLLSTSKTTNTDASSSAKNLTNQERILQESLGIQPETDDEKQARIQKRNASLNSTQNSKRKNAIVAILAFTAAILNYAYQFTHPITSLTLLTQMQNNSAELNVIGNNGKPTVVDFWASWCENCKAAAPTLMSIEEEYKDRVNFVMVNGDKGENWPIIERFGVDAIPHMAMVGSDGVIETALIGPIPRGVLKEDLNVMLENAEKIKIQKGLLGAGAGTDVATEVQGKTVLPYTMYDAFRSKPDMRQLNFPSDQLPIRLGEND